MTRSAIVLCGGRSTRMGRDKASLPFAGETLLMRAVRIVSSAANDVVVVARQHQDIPAGLIVVRDSIDDHGPLCGIVAGLHAIKGDLVFVTACDTPLLRPEVIARLFDRIGEHDVCVPVVDEYAMTLCAVYRRAVVPYAEALMAAGQLSVRALIDRLNAKRVDAAEFRDIDPELDSFFSCDTPERYEEALRKAAHKGPPYETPAS